MWGPDPTLVLPFVTGDHTCEPGTWLSASTEPVDGGDSVKFVCAHGLHSEQPMDPEEVDLEWLSEAVANRVPPHQMQEFIEGKTAIRDGVAEELDCSMMVAEQVVETMISRGMLRFMGDPRKAADTHGTWRLRPNPRDDEN
jgi:hypothetical protein